MTANLQPLITLREVHSELTETEHFQFICGIAKKCDQSILISTLFNGFYRSNSPQSDIDQIDTMTAIIRTIIEARVPAESAADDRLEVKLDLPDLNAFSDQDQKKMDLNLCDLSKEYTGEIASYLNESEYHRLSLVSRRIYLNIHSPVTLMRLHITSETKIADIPFSKIPLLNHITFQLNAVVDIPISIDDPKPMIQELLNTEYPIIRQTMNKLLKCIIAKRFAVDGTARGLRMRRMEHLGKQLVEQLSRARQIAADRSLIKSSNTDLPADWGMFYERIPKLTMYFEIIRELLNLNPAHIVPLLIAEANWNSICGLVVHLENESDMQRWVKNEDKLIVLQIILDIIEKHNVDPEKLFRSKLIDCLTSQYLIGTRGKDGDVVSEHMSAVVSTTFRLLTHFARDSPDPMETDESGQEAGNPRNWLSRRIVDQPWFLWTISEVVTPHNMYNSPAAADSILSFIEKVIDFKSMQTARTMMLKRACKKWSYQDATASSSHWYPRDTILRLLMLILRTKEDHLLFLQLNEDGDLLTELIELFLCRNLLEDMSCFSVMLDFFMFHVNAAIEYLEMRNVQFFNVIHVYYKFINGITNAYHTEEKGDEKMLCSKALQIVEHIFKCAKLYREDFKAPIYQLFIMEIVGSDLISLASDSADYDVLPPANPEADTQMIGPLKKIIDATISEDGMQCVLQEEFPIVWYPSDYSDAISPLLELFITNCVEETDFQWGQDIIAESTWNIMTYCVFLMCMKAQFCESITNQIYLALEQVLHQERALKSSIIAQVVYCVLMSSDDLDMASMLDLRVSNLFVQLHKGVVATLSEELNDWHHDKSRLLFNLKKAVVLKYLPLRFRNCVDIINEMLSKPTKDGVDDADLNSCHGFIKFYHHILCSNEVTVDLHIQCIERHENVSGKGVPSQPSTSWRILHSKINDGILLMEKQNNEAIQDILKLYNNILPIVEALRDEE